MAAVALTMVAVPAQAQEPTEATGEPDPPGERAPIEAAPVAAAPVGSAPVEAASALDLLGHGWGHGRGMGQYGALGYALDGWSADQILAHFYGGTSKATLAPSTMTVRLLARDGQPTTVTVGGGNRLVTRVGNGPSTLAPRKAVRLTHVGGGSYRISDGPGCAGPFTDRAGTVSGSHVAVQAAVPRGGGGGSESQFSYGAANAYVVAGDWDGDGVDTIGWRKPGNNVWHLRNSNSGGPDDLTFAYGSSSVELGDIPIAGDWDGDGIDTIGVYRTSNRTWYLRNSNTGGIADLTIAYGSPGDFPVPGDWDGDGDDTVGVVRGDTWLLRQSNTPGPAQITATFRKPHDVHVAGDTDGDGGDDRNSYNPTTSVFHLRDEDFDGRADQRITLGAPGSKPVIGDWDGDGIDEVGVFSGGQFTLDGIHAGGGFDIIDGNDPNLPIADTLQLCTGGSDVQWLRGEIRAARFESSQRTVNALDTEQYLRSVVPRESPASWASLGDGAGMAALEAQAVAARSYSLAENRYAYAKTCDTISCQVYAGRQRRTGGSVVSGEDWRTDAAIGATRGEIRRRAGATQRTEFSSSTGGYTAGGVFPAVIDEGDDVSLNPNHDWTTAVSASAIESYYGIPGFSGMTVVERNGLGEDGGRAVKVKLHFAGTTIERSGSQIQAAFGLKSDWFTPVGDTLPQPPPGNGPTLMLSNRLRTATADVTFRFGRRRDTVFAGDFDGDGGDTFVYRRGRLVTGSNELRSSPLEVSFSFGRAADDLYLGDWDGDGVDTFAVRRGNTFYVSNSLESGAADLVFAFGRAGDEPFVGDWDGDGRDTFAARRGNVFYVSNSLGSGRADHVFAFGRARDKLVIGDWDGDGRDSVIVRRGNLFYVSNSLRTGIAEQVFAFGRVGDEVYAGDWDADGDDTLGVRR